jgi:hypothetical protein
VGNAIVIPDEDSSLGSNEACSVPTNECSQNLQHDKTTRSDCEFVVISGGPSLASVLSAALKEHAASLDRNRTQLGYDHDSKVGVKNGAYPPGNENVPGQSDKYTNKGERFDGRDTSGDAVNATQSAKDVEPTQTSGEKDFLEGTKRFELTGKDPLDEIQAPVKGGVLTSVLVNSEVEGTVASSDGADDYHSTAQSLWELELFGLTLSEVKADIWVVLEELTGKSPVVLHANDAHASGHRTCGGCSWLTRLRCW